MEMSNQICRGMTRDEWIRYTTLARAKRAVEFIWLRTEMCRQLEPIRTSLPRKRLVWRPVRVLSMGFWQSWRTILVMAGKRT